MRVALISDIHGNLVALRAVLADIKKRSVDKVICLGDVAIGGPQPTDVIELLRRANLPCVMGNTDELVVEGLPAEIGANIPEEGRRKLGELHGWTLAKVSDSQVRHLSRFRSTMVVSLGANQTLLCYHGSPRSNRDRILPNMTEEEIGRHLEGHSAAVFAGGHTHVQMCRRYQGSLVINPGSVGLPFQRNPSGETHNPVKAEYATVSVVRRGKALAVELVSVVYPLSDLSRAVQRSDMPNKDWWLSNWY
jgi:putative phosphoesterase